MNTGHPPKQQQPLRTEGNVRKKEVKGDRQKLVAVLSNVSGVHVVHVCHRNTMFHVGIPCGLQVKD